MTPELSLAFALQSSPGVYALLLGSGVSRASRIPTGWEVVLDLVRKLASAQGDDCEPDPAAWYQEKYGLQPGYSQLLDALAKTQSERQQILRPYFEPSESELSEGVKSPTKAHRAIAELVASGYIRVVLTTNFDRLIERALEDVGVAPTVISTLDQISGAVPLVHNKCCVVKLHGDYLDTRILNTPEELAGYDPRLNQLLDRVFDEFGLISCGWSADWDDALRSAIERTPNRRYSTFFAVKGELGERASALLLRRGGQHVPIIDADSFFESLAQKVRAIEHFAQPHPLSVKAVVATCKQYLSEPEKARIRLADLIAEESRRICKDLISERFANTSEPANTESVSARVRHYEGLCQALCAIAFQVGRWGDIKAVEQLVVTQRRLFATKSSQGLTIWLAYQGYPLTLMTYSALLGASFGDRCDVIRPLLVNELKRVHMEPVLAVDMVPPFCLLSESPQGWGKLLEGKSERRAPLNDWLCDYLWGQFGEEFPARSDFELEFDWVETILAMANNKLCPPVFDAGFHPPGCFVYRTSNRARIVQRFKRSLEAASTSSPYVTSRLFGDSVEEAQQSIAALETWAAQLRWW